MKGRWGAAQSAVHASRARLNDLGEDGIRLDHGGWGGNEDDEGTKAWKDAQSLSPQAGSGSGNTDVEEMEKQEDKLVASP